MGRSGIGLQGDRGDDGDNCECDGAGEAVCLVVVSRGSFEADATTSPAPVLSLRRRRPLVLASVVVAFVRSSSSQLWPPPWSAPAGLPRTARHSLAPALGWLSKSSGDPADSAVALALALLFVVLFANLFAGLASAASPRGRLEPIGDGEDVAADTVPLGGGEDSQLQSGSGEGTSQAAVDEPWERLGRSAAPGSA